MNRVIIKSTVDSDGVLHLEVPLGRSEANTEVQVIVESLGPPRLTGDAWKAWVQSMAGSVTDPTFERPPQGEYETRDPM